MDMSMLIYISLALVKNITTNRTRLAPQYFGISFVFEMVKFE